MPCCEHAHRFARPYQLDEERRYLGRTVGRIGSTRFLFTKLHFNQLNSAVPHPSPTAASWNHRITCQWQVMSSLAFAPAPGKAEGATAPVRWVVVCAYALGERPKNFTPWEVNVVLEDAANYLVDFCGKMVYKYVSSKSGR